MRNPKSINELLKASSGRLSSLASLSAARDITRRHVRAALSTELAHSVVTAGFKDGKLTIGVSGAAWAARLRYEADALRGPVARALGTEIRRVHIKVVPTRA